MKPSLNGFDKYTLFSFEKFADLRHKIPPMPTENPVKTSQVRQRRKLHFNSLDEYIAEADNLAAQVRETYAALIAHGDGEADFISTVRHVERLAALDEPEL